MENLEKRLALNNARLQKALARWATEADRLRSVIQAAYAAKSWEGCRNLLEGDAVNLAKPEAKE